jgi:hypothetical protein
MILRDFKNKLVVGLPTLLIHKFPPYAYMDSWYAQSFNGQIRRAAKIVEIAEHFQPMAIIETGTFLGSSTPVLACLTQGEVHTLEINAKFAKKARKRFEKNHSHRRIDLVVGDSTTQLKSLIPKIVTDRNAFRLLCYLDAHWEARIPTSDELKLINEHVESWVAVIDDFKVDHDAGYGFDSYSSGTVDLSVVPNNLDVQVWVPKEPSNLESGARRGTAYVFSAKAIQCFPEDFFRNLTRVR